jgi:hypothetical protein
MMKKHNKRPKHFFILGAAKCGTSSLYHYLNQHPDIYMSRLKEPLYFEKDYEKGIEYYWKTYFPDWNGEMIAGEARHRNLYFSYIPQLIAESFPDAKLLVILRNPVDRAYSHYLHRKTLGLEKLSFDEAIQLDIERIEKERLMETEEIRNNYIRGLDGDGVNPDHRTYIDSGYYAEQIERYLNYFKRKQLLIVFFDEFKKDPKKVYFEILKFLDEKLSLIEIDFSIVNKKRSKTYESIHRYVSRIPKLQTILNYLISKKHKSNFLDILRYFEYELLGDKNMNSESRSWLISHYKEHNKRLEKLTGRDLSGWDEQYKSSK